MKRSLTQKSMLFILMLLACSVRSLGQITFTSSQNGDWSSSATWGGVGVPGINDSVIIKNNITISDDRSIKGVNISGSGHTITINTSATLTVYGDWNNTNTYTMAASGTVEFANASASTTGWLTGSATKSFYNVVIDAGATMRLGVGQTIDAAGNFTNSGTFDVINSTSTGNSTITIAGILANSGTFDYSPPSLTSGNITLNIGGLNNTGSFTTSAKGGTGMGSGTNTINVNSGDWINVGTYTHNNSTVIFKGTASTISGATNFYDLTYSKIGGTLTFGTNSTSKIDHVFTISGGGTTGAANSVVEFTTASSSIGGAITKVTFYTVQIDAGATLSTTSDIYLLDNWINNGGDFTTANNNKVQFNGAGKLTGNTTFYDLYLNASVDFQNTTTTITHTLTAAGGTMNGNTSTIVFTGNSGSMTGSHSKNFYNLQINSGSNVTNGSGSGNIHVSNSFTNNGTFADYSGNTFYFDESAANETLSGSGSTTFGNLTIGLGTFSSPTKLDVSTGFTIMGAALTFGSNGSSLIASSGTATFSTNDCTIQNQSGISGTSANFNNLSASVNIVQSNVANVTVNGSFNLVAAYTYTIGANTLTLNGDITGPGTITGSSTSNLVIGGTAGTAYFTQTSDRVTNMLRNFTVNTGAGVTLGNKLYITAGTSPGTVTANGTINTNSTTTDNTAANLVICSDKDGTASVGTSTGTITGSVTVERYIATGTGASPDHAKSWQLLAVPATGSQTVNQAWQENGGSATGYGTIVTSDESNWSADGFDAQNIAGTGTSVKAYNSTADNFDMIPNTTATPVYDVRGYFVFVRGDRSVVNPFASATPTTLRTTGTLFTPGGTNVPSPYATVARNRFQSVGNPYASAIDMRNFITSANLEQTYIVWDPRLGSTNGYGAFQYLTMMPDGNFYAFPGYGSYGYFTGSYSTSVPSNYIQSGQAFFIQPAVSATDDNNTVSFDESVKATGSSLITTPAPAQISSPQSLISDIFGTDPQGNHYLLDGTLSLFGKSNSNSLDGFDARKYLNGAENLAIDRNGTLLAIERRHTLQTQDTIFLQASNLKTPASYRFVFTANKIDISGLQPYLEDSYLKTKTPLHISDTTAIDFSTDANPGSTASNRFRIIFDAAAGPLPLTFTNVKAYTKNGAIAVDWQVDNQSGIASYDVERSTDGTRFNRNASFLSNNDVSAGYEWIDAQPAAGYNYYRIRSVALNGSAVYSNVVKAYMGTGSSRILLYPDPVSRSIAHLRFENEPAGNYHITLLNSSGQAVSTEIITVPATGIVYHDVSLPADLATGVYRLRVQNPAGETIRLNFVK